MIAEAAIAGVTICFVACLRFTRYVIERTDPFAEKRRILERAFELHRNAAKFQGAKPTEFHTGHAADRHKIQEELLKLADEEKAWRAQ